VTCVLQLVATKFVTCFLKMVHAALRPMLALHCAGGAAHHAPALQPGPCPAPPGPPLQAPHVLRLHARHLHCTTGNVRTVQVTLLRCSCLT